MNNEIKEILDYFNKYVNDKYETYTVVDENTKAIKVLLDYITNLQEENERLKQFYDKKGVYSLEYDKETLTTMICELQQENKSLRGNCKKMGKKIENQRQELEHMNNRWSKFMKKHGYLKQENKRLLVELNKEMIRNNKLVDETEKLQEKNKILKECYCNRTDCSGRIKDSKKYNSLQQRIDKAVEYIEKYNKEPIKSWNKPKEELLNILQGEDKNENN